MFVHNCNIVQILGVISLFERNCGSNLFFDLAAVVSDSSARLRWIIYSLYIFISLCFICYNCDITQAKRNNSDCRGFM